MYKQKIFYTYLLSISKYRQFTEHELDLSIWKKTKGNKVFRFHFQSQNTTFENNLMSQVFRRLTRLNTLLSSITLHPITPRNT